MTNPPSVPSLDVEACVRLLTELASELQAYAESVLMTAEGAAAYAAEAAQARALASALPGMRKDSEEVPNLRWRLTLAKSSLECYGRHHPWCASLDAADHEWVCDCGLQNLLNEPSAARAAQPEETSADAG